MSKELNEIIETVERLKRGVQEERLLLREYEKASLKEWSIDDNDLMNKSYLYGYLIGRFHLSFNLEESFTLLQECLSSLLFISYGVSEEGFHAEDILHAVNLVESTLRVAVEEVGKQLNLH